MSDGQNRCAPKGAMAAAPAPVISANQIVRLVDGEVDTWHTPELTFTDASGAARASPAQPIPAVDPSRKPEPFMPAYLVSYDLKSGDPSPHSAFLTCAEPEGWLYVFKGKRVFRLPNTTL